MSILAELQPDTIFAQDYRVIRKLSAGGMGAIYLAEQISTGRQRALKLMHPGLVGSPELRQKFALEARVGARVESEHVVEVVAAGVDKEVPWLAMELLVGQDLATLVDGREGKRGGAMAKEEVVAILRQVSHGLSAAHAAGIVHRDLKPENIFLAQARRANESFVVKILDFGIAKVVEAARGSNTGAIGSPLWMAPEQTERDAEISPLTDIWALGLVTFYMITGKVFWLAATQGDIALTAFLRELVIDPIPTATERATELGVADKVPAGFDTWFAHCVVRERAARYLDAKQCFEALCESLNVSPSAQPTIRIATGSSPISAKAEAMLAEARTMIDDSKPNVRTPKAAAGADDDDHPSVVPVQGPSPMLVRVAGVLLFVVLAAAGIFAVTRRPTVKPDPVPTGSTASPLPFCPKGMVRISGADLVMGSNAGPTEEQPEHPVKVASFCLDVLEVTVADYSECVTKNGCPPPHATVDWPDITKEERDTFSVYCNYAVAMGPPAIANRREHPMNCVSFDEAAGYCKWAGKRLPTEDQWEYAARGTDGRAYPWGHEPPGPRRANACDDGCAKPAKRTTETLGKRLSGDDNYESTSPVGAYPEGVSASGAFDMAGNVAEWIDAPYCPYGQSACGTASRVIRGGSWMTDAPIALRTTARAKAIPASRAPDVGLRCVK